MADREEGAVPEGLHEKFTVRRTDPAADARHRGCFHFVLDVTHDPLARVAIVAYADAVAPTDLALAHALYRAAEGVGL